MISIGKAINDFITGLQHTIMFFITLFLFIFVVGEWYGVTYRHMPMFWWPVYLLIIALVVYIILDLQKEAKK
ncbi:hypothetical protein DRN74_02580 [Candidatus Micrarchaeota archaeon]|nr:MAG: hypothetical protein DRN74_02580 [Candidatus Micrarchaeota archaeon]